MLKQGIGILLFLTLGAWMALPASAEMSLPEPIKMVKIEQKLHGKLPLDTVFKDESGREVTLGDFFGRRPVILVFVYYECPMLCTLILNGTLRTLRSMKFTTGKEFDVVAISFDPEETPDLALDKKNNYVKQYNRPGSEGGWHFLTGSEASIEKVTQAAGFNYVYDPERDEYAHASALMVVTPEGMLSQYFYGIEYPARDLRLALVEASKNKIGSLVDQILLFCFHYNPITGKYGFAIMSGLRIFGVLTVAFLALYIVRMVRREKMA